MSFGQVTSDAFNWWSVRASFQGKVLVSIALIAVFVLLRMLVLSLIHQRVTDTTVAYVWRRRTTSLLTVLAIVLLAWLWSDTFHSIATLLGLVAAALVLAVRDLVANMAGWVFIHSRRLFRVGDRIEVSGYTGDVIDIKLFEFTLVEVGNWVDADQSSGRLVHVPNGKVLSEPLANYTKDFNFIWNELSVVVTFESNWQKTKSILEDIAARVLADTSQEARRELKKAAQRYMIFFRNLKPIVYIKVQDNGIRLTVRYLTRPRQRRTSENRLWEEILARFAEHDELELAYPTVRYYQRGEADRLPPSRSHSSRRDEQRSKERDKAKS